MYDASADSSHSTARATSSGCPPRPIGTPPLSRSTRPGSPALAWISVSISPGATALTRMPSPATSRARPKVKLSMAPLDAA